MKRCSCSCAQLVCILGAILFIVLSFIALTVGYIVPVSHSKEYQPRACSVISTEITHPFSWVGHASLQFGSLTKTVLVIESNSKDAVSHFIHDYYPIGISNVACYVSSDDIVVSLDVSNIGLAVTGVCLIIGILFAAIFISITLKHGFRRSGYVELDEKVAGTEPVPL